MYTHLLYVCHLYDAQWLTTSSTFAEAPIARVPTKDIWGGLCFVRLHQHIAHVCK